MTTAIRQANNESYVKIDESGKKLGVSFKSFDLNLVLGSGGMAGDKCSAVYIRFDTNDIIKLDKSGLTIRSISLSSEEKATFNFHRDGSEGKVTVGSPFEFACDRNGVAFIFRKKQQGERYGPTGGGTIRLAPDNVLEIVAIRELPYGESFVAEHSSSSSTQIVSEFETAISGLGKEKEEKYDSEMAREAPKYLQPAMKLIELCTRTTDGALRDHMALLVNVMSEISIYSEAAPENTTQNLESAAKRGMDVAVGTQDVSKTERYAEINTKCLRAAELLNVNPNLARAAATKFIEKRVALEQQRTEQLFVANGPGQWEEESAIAKRKEMELSKAKQKVENEYWNAFGLLWANASQQRN